MKSNDIQDLLNQLVDLHEQVLQSQSECLIRGFEVLPKFDALVLRQSQLIERIVVLSGNSAQ